MKEARHLSTLKEAIVVFTPVMTKFLQEHHAYKFQHNGSGWVFSNFASFHLTLWHLDPLRASAFVPLPGWIHEKKATVNVTGTGDDCFKWAVLAGIHPVGRRKHPDRMNTYEEHVNKYDFSSFHFPVPLSSIGSFAKANNLSISVYGVENEKKVVYPLRVSQTVVRDRHVDLLLYEYYSIQHYTTIRSFSRLVSSQLSNHNGATYFCRRCLHGCSTQALLEAHAVDCNHAQRTKFPTDSRCRFTNVQKQLPTPSVVYADFESILKPVNGDVDVTQGVDIGIESSTHVFQEHIPCSFANKK